MKEIKNNHKSRKKRRKKIMRTLRYTVVITVAVAILAVAIALLIKGAQDILRDPDDKGDQGGDRIVTVTEPVQPSGAQNDKPSSTPTATPTGGQVPEPTATPTGEPTATPTPTQGPVVPVLQLDKVTGSTASFSMSGFPEETMQYMLRYKPSDATEWMGVSNENTIGALIAGKQYDAELIVYYENSVPYVSEIIRFTPEGNGFGDPFKNACAILQVNGESRTVSYTKPEGCLGVNAWMEFDEGLYTSADLTEKVRDLVGGTAMRITEDENGQYVCSLGANRYAVHVTVVGVVNGEADNSDVKDGWVLGNAILVDLAMIFPSESPYSIQYDRTNSYSSIFTCGGDPLQIDADSPEETRYDPLRTADGATSLVTGGRNVIDDVTGQALPNYGASTQMPAVWDLALQLLTAQRNALEKGCCLLIYESYRPNSTSKAVYKAMKAYGYFRTEISVMMDVDGKEQEKKLTLANGFLDMKLAEENYIAIDSNHNKGIALDLTIRRYDTISDLGAEVEMQTKMHALDYRSNMDYNTEEAKLLYSIMTEGTGLIPLRRQQEWWHFELNKNVEDFPCITQYVFADYEL